MENRSSDYYEAHYYRIQRKGFQGWGNSLIDREIEKLTPRRPLDKILEVGASSGEHLRFVSRDPIWSEYICADKFPGLSNPSLFRSLSRQSKMNGGVEFIQCDVHSMPFEDNRFTLVISTCLLAHVDSPMQVLHELRRVTQSAGSIVIGMPCDPGFLNRMIKTFITYPKMRKSGISNPRLNYALEHRNPIHNLIELIKEVFKVDKVEFYWFPFKIPSWNFELALTCRIEIIKD